jgi:DHA1 family bicyclomycin/chloramphenicol resistance-like MFS transporter
MNPTLTKSMLIITVVLMDLLAGMQFDLFVPSFPELQAHFHLSPFWVEALISINFIGYCVSLFFVGGLADRYGRKPLIVGGFLIFILGSLFCLEGQLYFLILIGCFLQGVGIAAPAILSFLIIADLYDLKKQQYYMAMLNGVTNVGIGAAPILGSYITLYFHWRGNFATLLLLGVVGLGLTLLFIPSYPLPNAKETLSFRAYLPLLQSKPLMLLILNIVCMFLPYWIFVGIAPLLYMQDLGVSLSHFGYYQGALALVFAFGSVAFGLVMNRYSTQKMLFWSNQLLIACFIALLALTFTNCTKPLLITLVLVLFTATQVIPSSVLYPVCVNFSPQSKGRISALIHGIRLLITAICLQIAGYFYEGSFRSLGMMLSLTTIFLIASAVYVLKNRELMKRFEK